MTQTNIPHEIDLHTLDLDRYRGLAHDGKLDQLRELASRAKQRLGDHVVWHVNSTAEGGGVAEMLPSLLGYCSGLGVASRWLTISGDTPFFRVTKRLHHALHGAQGKGPALDAKARTIYQQTLQTNLVELLALIQPGDVVILHDPQTAGLAPGLRDHGARVIWRCHIGHNERNDETEAGWRFLEPYLQHAERFVFSRRAYVPAHLDHGKSAVIAPSIDAFTPKNQPLSDDAVRTILVHTGLIAGPLPAAPCYEYHRSDGSSQRINRYVDIIRCGPAAPPDVPLITQISRWDPLKDAVGVMHGFVQWLERYANPNALLVLAGPSVHGVADDPEGVETFQRVFLAWCELPHMQRSRIDLAMLPMRNVEENAAIVNALQRYATVVVQKSLQEGFGLTVTEPMWKGRPVIASGVGGICDQIDHGHNGLLVDDPTDVSAFADALERLISDHNYATRLGAAARESVREHYLEVRSVRDHLELILQVLDTATAHASTG